MSFSICAIYCTLSVIQQSTNTLMARRSSSFVPWVDLLLEHTFQGSSVCTSCITLVPLLLESSIRCVYAARRWSAWSFCSLLKSVRNLEDCLMVSLFAQSAGRVDAYGPLTSMPLKWPRIGLSAAFHFLRPAPKGASYLPFLTGSPVNGSNNSFILI